MSDTDYLVPTNTSSRILCVHQIPNRKWNARPLINSRQGMILRASTSCAHACSTCTIHVPLTGPSRCHVGPIMLVNHGDWQVHQDKGHWFSSRIVKRGNETGCPMKPGDVDIARHQRLERGRACAWTGEGDQHLLYMTGLRDSSDHDTWGRGAGAGAYSSAVLVVAGLLEDVWGP